MAQQTINVGTSPNDGAGTPLRTAFQYTNSNFSELYTAVGPSGNNIVVPGSATITGGLTVDTSTLKVDSANNRVGIVQASPLYPLHLVGEFGLEEASPAGTGTKLRFIGDATKYNFRLGKQLTANNTFEITPSTAVGGGTFSNPVYTVSYDGIHTFLDGAGGTRMTLNSTGLGVGVVPSAGKFEVQESGTGAGIGGIFASTASGGGNPGFVFRTASTNRWSLSLTGFAGAESIRFYDINNSATRLLIDSSGNVGIGVTPSAWNSSYRGLQLGAGGAISAHTSASLPWLVATSNSFINSAGDWKFINNGYSTRYLARGDDGTQSWWTSNNGSAGGTVAYTQAMTLDASGFLRLAASNASSAGSYWFQVKNTGASSNAVWLENLSGNDRGIIVLKHDQATGATSGTMAVFQNGGGSNVGSITSTNTATAYNIASDYRLKESVKTLSGGIARISALKPSIYKWKSDGSSGEGFLAHELAEVVPLAVTGEKDAVNEDGTIKPQQVDLSKVVPVLVAAIQELTARVQTLETR